jgi:hypothetical protein
MVLRGHKNQTRACLGVTRLRRAPERVQNADHHSASGGYADADRNNYCEAKNQRHEKRNHVHHPILSEVN